MRAAQVALPPEPRAGCACANSSGCGSEAGRQATPKRQAGCMAALVPFPLEEMWEERWLRVSISGEGLQLTAGPAALWSQWSSCYTGQ